MKDFSGSFYDDIVILSNDLLRGYLPAYGNDTIIGLETPDGPNNSYIAYFHLHVDDNVTDQYIVVNYDEGSVEKTVIGGEFEGTYQDTFTGYVGSIIGSKGDDVFYGLSSDSYYVPVAGFYPEYPSGTVDLGYGAIDAYLGDDTIIALGSGEDRLLGGEGKDLIVIYGHGEKDKISGEKQEGDDISNNPAFDTFVIGGKGKVQITDYQIGEEIILLDYDIQSADDITISYDSDLDQTSLSFISKAEDHNDRVLVNGSLEIDSFEQTIFINQYRR